MRIKKKLDNNKTLCDHDCNHCPIINHPNSRMITKILNQLYNEDEYVLELVNEYCPNLTVCYDCRLDDFFHLEDCNLK